MDIPDDEIDIQLRSPEEVGRRMIALAAVASRAGSFHDGPDVNDIDDPERDEPADDVEERFDWLAWLADHGLTSELCSDERSLLQTADPDVTDEAVDTAATAAESLGALAWATRLSELSVLDRGYPYEDLLERVPSPWDDPSPFLTSLDLRPEADIATARDAAELLYWRALVEVERRVAKGRDLLDIDAAIRDVAAEAAESGVMPVGRDGDLLIGGEPVRSLSASVLESMVAAAHARLRAVSWLCGLGEWDDSSLTDL